LLLEKWQILLEIASTGFQQDIFWSILT